MQKRLNFVVQRTRCGMPSGRRQPDLIPDAIACIGISAAKLWREPAYKAAYAAGRTLTTNAAIERALVWLESVH